MSASSAPIRSLAALLANYRNAPSRLIFHDILEHFLGACREVGRCHASGRRGLTPTPDAVRRADDGAIVLIDADATPNRAALAPEILDAAAPPTVASDVYGLGVLLYHCLAGRPPYEGTTATEIEARVREGLPWPPSTVAADVPPPLEAVCLKAMDIDPRLRHASAADLARDVEIWRAGALVQAEKSPSEGVFSRLRRLLGPVALPLLVVLAVGGALYGIPAFWQQREEIRNLRAAVMEAERKAAETRQQTQQTRAHLAATAKALAQASLAANQPLSACGAFRQAAATLDAAAADGDGTLWREAAALHHFAGNLAARLHDLAGARSDFTRGLAALEQAAAPPRERAATQAALGDIERRDHRPEAAQRHFEAASALLDGEESDPQTAGRRQALKQAADEAKDVARAADDEAFALDPKPERAARLLVGRSATLARRGRPTEAAAAAEKLRALAPKDGSNLYNVGCCLGLCAAAERDPATRSGYATRALDALRDAVAAGWKDAAHTENDPDWLAVRGDARFAAIVRQLRVRQAWRAFPVGP